MHRSTSRPQRAKRVISLVALAAMLSAQSAQGFTISNVPLQLPTAPAPNIIVTLDDSGSMRWAYAPDALCSTHNTRRAKSAAFNPLYYDPATVYALPPRADGTLLSTSFTNAWINGFDSTRGGVNLSNDYRVTWAYNPATAVSGLGTSWNQCGGTATNNNWAEHPAQEYNTTATGDLRRSGVAAYYYVYSPATTACAPADRGNDACYEHRTVGNQNGPADVNGDGVINGDDERQNFANWFSFYRTRNLLTVSAAATAFRDPILSTARIAWQSLSHCNERFTASGSASCRGWDTSVAQVNRRIRVFDDAHRTNMYSWLFRLPANSSTPLRPAMERAGQYYQTSTASNGTNTPYAENPQVTAGREFTCRPNFHILMTDGIWNTGGESNNSSNANYFSASYANADGGSRTLPDGTVMSSTATESAIYRDSNSNALADIAFHFWATDLRTDLANNVIPYFPVRSNVSAGSNTIPPYWNPKNDPANWQHMVTFTVGLGLTNTLSVPGLEWTGDTWGPGGGYDNLLAGTQTWPATGSDASPGNVYDLWHAAINSRGQAFAADNPTQLGVALKKSLNRVFERNSGSAAAAVNSTRLTEGAVVFQTLLDSKDWSGEVLARRLNSDGTVGDVVWSTADANKIPSADVRQGYTFTWNGSAAVPFSKSGMDDPVSTTDAWSKVALTPVPATASTVAVEEDDVVRYVLGDASKEQRFTNGIYRDRPGPLADIVNSDPVYVAAERFSYSTLPEGGASAANPYLSFVASKSTRRKMLYVGSNGGMLHAFDASYDPTKTRADQVGGREIFTYVPGAVLENLQLLTQPIYGHRYFVDGSPTAWDAYFQNPRASEASATWKTVLLGTTGAGARGVFAIDVTNPDAVDATKILWEINKDTPNSLKVSGAEDPNYSADLGFTIGEASVGRMNNGEWVAVFGNGYRSPNNRAVLYVVRLSDGALLRKFDTGAGSAGSPNGLGTPTLVDRNGDQIIDYAYAGDQLGNVWKFDLTSNSASSWSIAFGGLPLFQARSAGGVAQPISVRIRTARKPASATSVTSGRMLVFGTGRMWAVGDNLSTAAQTFYGLLDDDNATSPISGRSVLQAQTITTSGSLRTLSNNTVNWSTQRGWMMDLPDSGERVIGPARVAEDRVLFASIIPSSDPCEFGGTSWLMQVDAQNGRTLNTRVFDTDNNGVINSSDTTASGVAMSGLIRQAALIEDRLLASSTASTEIQNRLTQFSIQRGRDAWREVLR